MPLVYRMPSLDRALQVAAILLGNHVQAREEVRCSEPVLVVDDHSPLVDAAVHRLEPQAQLILPDGDDPARRPARPTD
jgi:hypothetical protein